MGTRNGMEKEMIGKLGVKYKGIYCGKLRRYFSISNFVDFFKTPIGIIQSFFAIIRFSPDAVFCKGGYVSFPIVLGARLAGKKVYLHESDAVPGLANRLSARFATKIFVSFMESMKYFPSHKVILTGNPIRPWIDKGDIHEAMKITGFKGNLPVILVMGGSQGAGFINDIIWDNLPELTHHHRIIHVCGKNKTKTKDELIKIAGKNHDFLRERYFSLEFAGNELKDFYALCDLVISRAGANSLAEIEAVHKPAILIPLGLGASRGDQIINAKVFSSDYPAAVINEEDFDKNLFLATIDRMINVKPDTQKISINAAAADNIINEITRR